MYKPDRFQIHDGIARMLPEIRSVVSPERFDALFDADVKLAELALPEEESAYERRDAFLIHLIKDLVAKYMGTVTDGFPHILEDWWPNHTRYIDLTPLQCTNQFLQALHGLLTDEFSDYRIQICVYDGFEGESYVGSMVLYADRMVLETGLNRLLTLD